jgi:hypothetical protein
VKRTHLWLACLVVGAMLSVFGQDKGIAGAGERTTVDLTIYNQNLSLIRE